MAKVNENVVILWHVIVFICALIGSVGVTILLLCKLGQWMLP